MNVRESLIDLKAALAPFARAVLFVVTAVLIVWFAPARAAAILLGVLVAGALYVFLVRKLPHARQLAFLWAAIAVSADAACAKLNDQTPVTMANALMKLAEGAAKLADSLLKGVGIAAAGTQVKIAAVIPDFVWTLILCAILFAWLGFSGKERAS
jgi:hypothetical protein